MVSTRTTNTITVFIDSSVLVAASISQRGSGRELLTRALVGKLNAYISDDVLEETERNIAEKKPAALPAFCYYRDALVSKVINPSMKVVKEVAKVVEPKDAPIVAAAIEASALYLASYDQRHLLGQKEQIWDTFGVIVLTPIEVLYLLPPDTL